MTIICPNCRATHVQGTIFCEQCGTSLIGVLPVTANPAADAGTPFDARRPVAEPLNGSTPPGDPVRDTLGGGRAGAHASSDPDPADEGPGTMPLAGMQERESGRLAIGSVPTRLRVLVLNTGRLTEWIDEPVIHVGRTDRSANVFPTIDLETDGGQNAGVSRRHVRMSRQPDGYYLEDLGSINGSFLNRRRLSPGNPTELKDGDEVRLGNIVLRIVLGGFQRNQ